MDVQNPAQPPTPVPQTVGPLTSEQPAASNPKSSKWIVAAIVVSVAAIGTAGYLLYNNLAGKTQNTQNTVEPLSIPTTITTPPVEPSPTLTPTSIPVSTPTSTPTVDEASLLKTVIKEALVAKLGSDANSLDITVSQINGNYAKGGASAEGGGGMWFAAKVNGIWKLVWDGNGVILCSDLTSYPDFPSSMIPECWNEATQKTVQR